MKRFLSLFIAVSVLSTPVTLAAEETEPELTPEQLAAMQAWEDRVERAEDFRNRMLQTRQGITLFEEFAIAMQKKLADQRKNCRDLQRKANHFTELRVTQNCYRTILLMQEDMVRKQRDVAASIPGISNSKRIELLKLLDELIESIDALSFAIDSNVFESIDELIESKQNLYEKYRKPVLLNSVIARAERNLTWIAHLMVRMLGVVEANAELTQETFNAIDLGMQCYIEGEGLLKNVLVQTAFETASESLGAAQEHLATCNDLFKQAHMLYTESPPPPVTE